MTWDTYDADRHESTQDDPYQALHAALADEAEQSGETTLEQAQRVIRVIREAQQHKPGSNPDTRIILCVECYSPWPCFTRQALALFLQPRNAPGGVSPGYITKQPPPEPDPVPQPTGWWARLRPAIQRFLGKETL